VSFPSDIEIAQRAKLRPITDVAAELDLTPDDLDLYGKYKAKIPLEITQRPPRGRLVRGEGRRRGRWVLAGPADGRHQPALHG
jgi:formyltetrahydrofolate synthetase